MVFWLYLWRSPSTPEVQNLQKKSDKNSLRGNISFATALYRAHYPAVKRQRNLNTMGTVRWRIFCKKLISFQREKNKIIVSDDHSRQHWDPSDWGLGRGDSDKNSIDMSNRTLSNFELTLKSPKNIFIYAEYLKNWLCDTGLLVSRGSRCCICCFCLPPVGGSVSLVEEYPNFFLD